MTRIIAFFDEHQYNSNCSNVSCVGFSAFELIKILQPFIR